uniref:Uncharacterized protein n=1 Tax=Anopheles epiroticus TaxID=199890 RepID=A0A182P4T1_9DIPT
MVLPSTKCYFWGTLALLAFVFHTCHAVTPSGKVDFSEADDLNDENNGGFVSVYKNYPKIQVTVDTQKLKRVPQPETKSDESSSGSSGSSGSESVERPSVGVRTDITIEISEESANDTRASDRDGKKDRNGQSGAGNVDVIRGGGDKKDRNGNGKGTNGEDDDNASIPVFKGMAGVSTKKPKPTATRGTASHSGTRPIVTYNHRPTVTSFYGPGSDDRNRISGEYDGWNAHYPTHTVTAVWTTERPYLRRVDYDYAGQHRSPPYYKGYVPYNVGHQQQYPTQSAEHAHHHAGDWKPCYCSIYQPWGARAPSNPVLPGTGTLHPTAHPPPRNTVDNKVDIPSAIHSPPSHQQHYRSIHS